MDEFGAALSAALAPGVRQRIRAGGGLSVLGYGAALNIGHHGNLRVGEGSLIARTEILGALENG
jgi:hypothetical protein